jgi:hypothetical protein
MDKNRRDCIIHPNRLIRQTFQDWDMMSVHEFALNGD